MTFQEAVKQLQAAIIETPFPDLDVGDAGISYRRTAQAEPYGHIYSMQTSWCVFLDAGGKPVLWYYSRAHEIWHQVPDPDKSVSVGLINWQLDMWSLHFGPWEITNWVKEQRT